MDFEQVEEKIIAELKAQVPGLKTVEGYAGQLEGEIEKLPVKFPAAFVVYEGSAFEWVDGPSHSETAEFAVMVCSSNLRGASDSRGAAYDLVKAVLAALVNSDFGLEMEKLRPVRTALVFTNRSITVYGIDFQTSFDKAFNW